jgi:hypothetical protein
MANPNEETRLIVTFENFPVLNEAKSREANRPIYEDMEVCRIRMGGDRLQAPVFPAWAEAPGGAENEDGYIVPMTYKEKYAEQYRKFKAGEVQTKEGTPIEALSFLTPARVKEFKALNIYTAESLASLEGASLKSLGQGGLEWKTKAKAYLENAAGSANVTKLASENEFLKQQLEELRKERAQWPATERVTENLGYGDPEQEESMTDAELKDLIEEKTGSRPRGNPSRETLIKMVKDLD